VRGGMVVWRKMVEVGGPLLEASSGQKRSRGVTGSRDVMHATERWIHGS
jgi:hypothetical protein